MPETEIMANALVKNQETKKSLYKDLQEIVGNWKPPCSVLKETTVFFVTMWIGVQNRHSRIFLQYLQRSRMRKMRREQEVLEAEAQVEEWLDCRAKVNSKELAPLQSVKWSPPECLFYKSKSGCRFSDKCSCSHRQVDEQPNKGSKEWWQTCGVYVENYTTNGLRISKNAAAEVFIDFAEELKHTETNPMYFIQ